MPLPAGSAASPAPTVGSVPAVGPVPTVGYGPTVGSEFSPLAHAVRLPASTASSSRAAMVFRIASASFRAGSQPKALGPGRDLLRAVRHVVA